MKKFFNIIKYCFIRDKKRKQYIKIVNNLINLINDDLCEDSLKHIYNRLIYMTDIYHNHFYYLPSKSIEKSFHNIINNCKKIILLENNIYNKEYIDGIIKVISDVDIKYMDLRDKIYKEYIVNRYANIPYSKKIRYIDLCDNEQIIKLSILLKH
jgi:hypothetical protein